MPISWSKAQIGEWLVAFWETISDWALKSADWLLGVVISLIDATTQDHLEGAGVMALILLGPSLTAGLLGGFWDGLRIEWRQYRGRPRVIDGDTLELRGERIRLFGVDAPELGQPWWDRHDEERDAGQLSKDALVELIDGRRLDVQVLREDQYQRSVAIVKVDGKDVARTLVSRGYAFASPGSSRYRRTELSAKRQKLGFWRGELIMPWEYRAAT